MRLYVKLCLLAEMTGTWFTDHKSTGYRVCVSFYLVGHLVGYFWHMLLRNQEALNGDDKVTFYSNVKQTHNIMVQK